jgi:hypothetical protein
MVEAPALRGRVEAELLVTDGIPQLDALERLGARSDVAVVLAEIALDSEEAPLARHRALALIADFPSPRGQEALERVQRTTPSAYTRAVATRALERMRTMDVGR